MPKEDWKKDSVQKIFEKEGLYPSGKIRTVLDLGCGLSFKAQYIDAIIRVGVDIYLPYLEQARKQITIEDPYVLIKANILEVDKLFLPKSFDLVLILGTLEHLLKRDGLRLLEVAEGIASKAVIIDVPRGYIPQNIDILGFGAHDLQTHRSAWEPLDFKELGYKVLVRDYVMSDVKRHTDMEVDPKCQIIDAIKLL